MSKNRNRGYQNKKHGKFNNASVGDKAKEVLSNIDENNRVMRMFKDFSKELDQKHDRYERIVKLSRDITIESKRIIFSLHSTNTDMDDKKQSVFVDVETRLNNLMQTNFKQIALELHGLDPYLYQKAYTNGMQEFIEALVFYQYLKNGEIEPWEVINRNFVYENEEKVKIILHFSHYDFILGIADFTGELMRRCINNLGIGNVEDCFKLCDCVRYINAGFLGIISPGQKEIGRKVYTLKQSLAKMELVCYNLRIRGSEIPKHMLVSVLDTQQEMNDDEDEGFY
ncbi:translin-associated protein X [Coccinella septempunctata]|uniref:translin-associated protein X n=1 Tax=Coccinella septempunctata TaxID=41139 RepID=UPI001D0635A7|nr:translin-associated protein X [Coccinella septempunctata]